MARVDDYQQARDLAAGELARQPLAEIAARSGFAVSDDSMLLVPFLGRIYLIRYPEFTFTIPTDQTAPPLQEQVLILHYLQGSRPVLQNKWIAYRDIPGAGLYYGPFVKRAVEPLKKKFGSNAAGFASAADLLGAKPVDTGSAAYRFDPLPYVPVQLILWEGDDEFPSEANILFDAAVGEYLSPEDAAWLAGMVVYRLIAIAQVN